MAFCIWTYGAELPEQFFSHAIINIRSHKFSGTAPATAVLSQDKMQVPYFDPKQSEK